MNIDYVGNGNVVLIAGGGKCYTDIAARFCRSEKGLEEILASPYDKDLVDRIINSNHGAATEFDYFIFGVEGYARVTEIQLVRKRIASYLIKSGRAEKGGKRSFDVVLPESIEKLYNMMSIDAKHITLPNGASIATYLPPNVTSLELHYGTDMMLALIESWYNHGVELGYAEQNLRYMKPQATEFKAIIGMNAHALIDWFKIRCCLNAQKEIRDMANKMLTAVLSAQYDLFKEAGASCRALGYCPENAMQNKACKRRTLTHDAVKQLIKDQRL